VFAQVLDQGNATFLGHAQDRDDKRDGRVKGQFLQGEGDGSCSETDKSLVFEGFGELDQGVLFVVHQ